MENLPIFAVLPALLAMLKENIQCILEAPPGAGKSTAVPLALLQADWLQGQTILLLEPRRIATRAVARRMAQMLGEALGQRVGYRMRLENRLSAATRIEVVTEGMLARQIQHDPELSGVGCIIFDEFHERSLQADLGLALALDVQENLRPDLRILVMSATLDSARLARVMPDAALLRRAGRQFPVETLYRPPASGQDALFTLVPVVMSALQAHTGNVLVFLPGSREIRLVAERLHDALQRQGEDAVEIAPLFGGLDSAAQDRAIAVPAAGRRKIVLATDLAETSLTIEGISIVVDLGLQRYSAFSPRTGMSSLLTGRAAQASCDQRRGRAGRLGPGVCYRLWSESEQQQRAAHAEPEILLADLAPLLLELAAWGVTSMADLRWLDLPADSHLQQAHSLLSLLGALNESGRLTPHGTKMANLGTHPRLAHMLIQAAALGSLPLACEIAAWLGERNPLRGPGSEDFSQRLALLRADSAAGAIYRPLLAQVRKQAAQFRRLLPAAPAAVSLSAGALLAMAYPDRVAQRRAGSDTSYLLANGSGAAFRQPNLLSRSEYLVVTELDGQGREANIFSAVEVSLGELLQVLESQLQSREQLDWDERQERVVAENQRSLGKLVLQREPIKSPDPQQVAQALLQAVRKRGLSLFEPDEAIRQWQFRVQLMRRLEGTQSRFPDVSDAGLLASAEAWLLPWLQGITRLAGVKKLKLGQMLEGLLDWEQKQQLERLLPSHFVVPSGSRIRIQYQDEGPPLLAVRLQEMFSSRVSPALADGRVPLLIHLLSPAQRPIQITQDLLSFWSNGYAEVKKELKGRYPKHHWPDDPLHTPPHRSVRPK